jgi:hypothetical protein
MPRLIGLFALAQTVLFAPSGEAQGCTLTVQDLNSGQSAILSRAS